MWLLRGVIHGSLFQLHPGLSTAVVSKSVSKISDLVIRPRWDLASGWALFLPGWLMKVNVL
jgi:hypothetical protein